MINVRQSTYDLLVEAKGGQSFDNFLKWVSIASHWEVDKDIVKKAIESNNLTVDTMKDFCLELDMPHGTIHEMIAKEINNILHYDISTDDEVIRSCQLAREMLFKRSKYLSPWVYNAINKTIDFNIMSYLPRSNVKYSDTVTYLFYSKILDMYKIGRSKDANKRLRQINQSTPVSAEIVHIIEKDIEKELHRKFADKRGSGTEWFNLSEDDVDYIYGR